MPNPATSSGIRDNHHRGVVADFLKAKIHSGSRLSVVSAYFTIYAYDALRKHLDQIDHLDFLFGEPRFIASLDPDKTEKKAFILDGHGLQLANRLEQKRVARDCAGWIREKVDIKSIRHAQLLHGKMYHIANAGVEEAILGSSNFTVRGLGRGAGNNNIELNLEVDSNRDRRDLKVWFDELWNDPALVEDVKAEVLQYLDQLYQNHVPEFIYFKTLFHVFENFLADQEKGGLLDQNIKIVDTGIWQALFEFQRDGVKGAINKILKHNGCILADSVGLGKTFEALAVIKYFELKNERVLVLCPKKLRENWTVYRHNDALNPFISDRFRYDVLSHTDLSRDSGKSGDLDLATFNWGNFDLVVIDESHNFRNNTPGKRDEDGNLIRKSRYQRLMDDIIKGGVKTKVLLLSATPVNNDLRDLRNQIYFLTENNDGAFKDTIGISSLKDSLAAAQRTFSAWTRQQTGERKTKDLLERLSSAFFKLLDELTIARSRKHIQRYYKSSIAALGGFPERRKPESTFTEMDKRGWTKEKQNFMAHSLYRFREDFQKPDAALDLFKNIPFLNGGLFECLDKDRGEKASPRYERIDGFSRREDSQPVVPDFLFFGPERDVDLSADYGDNKFKKVKVRGLIHTLNHYKFTVAENTPIEEEIALDPELSGKVFENLLAAYNPETGATARKQTGSFYTPREIVNYMVDEALIACLKTKLETALQSAKDVEPRLRHLFAYNNEPHKFTAPEVDALIAAIDSLKSLDPAVGSGAFPMGILHKLVFILGKLDPRNEKWKERQIARVRDAMTVAEKIEDATVRERAVRELEQQITGINDAFEHNELDYGRKLYLIENCIYGVDIQPIAVQIAKMRFFISLIVDQKIDDTQPNRGVRPLPNLETKFVAANTLIGVNRPGQQLLRNREIDAKEAELRRVRERHFLARTLTQKRKCREQDEKLRAEIAELLKGDGWDTATARKLASWNPYDQNASADFFDAEWMFGITEGFDICEGNPPYVGKQALQQQQPEFAEYAKDHFQAAKGRDFDLFALFIERSIGLVRVGGIVSFIVPTGWYSGPGFSALRRHVLLHSDPLAFVNLPYDMFEEAWVDTTVFHTRRRQPILRCPLRPDAGANPNRGGRQPRLTRS